jgi:Indole-3-glycerol phosphate synthase
MILDEILTRTSRRVAEMPASPGDFSRGPRRSLNAAILATNNVYPHKNAVIAELKFASPSRGVIRTRSEPGTIACELAAGGCTALSVLTEPDYFCGSGNDVMIVRNAVDVPVLRKDFIIDERQLDETLAMGADAVLLLAGVLKERLSRFVTRCYELDIEPLVEVRSRKEVECALKTDAQLIGINNRDLATMQVSIRPTLMLGNLVRKEGRVLVTESGMLWPCDVRCLKRYCDAFLIGSALMGSEHPRKKLEGFVYA